MVERTLTVFRDCSMAITVKKDRSLRKINSQHRITTVVPCFSLFVLLKSTIAMTSTFPKLVQCKTQRFFGIIGKGPFDTCGPTFGKLNEILQASGLAAQLGEGSKQAMLVLCDVPKTDKADLVWACATLIPDKNGSDKNLSLPQGLEEIIVPGKRCATTVHRGGYEGLPTAWGDLCMKWVPSQNLKPAAGSRENVHYEVYMNMNKDNMETQLFCPVEDM